MKNLEEFCNKSFDRLFKLLEERQSAGRSSPRRSSSPSRGCYGCGQEDHFIAQCPKRGILRKQNDSPSPKKRGDETGSQQKVSFSPSSLNKLGSSA